ncbi:MAG: sugar ABC transporter permease [Lachnospiraceae bacterium]|nr:sugar ABC transporter permease [Lachnospiraceae bacterium]
MEKKNDSVKVVDFIKKYAMIIIFAAVLTFFTIATKGIILSPVNVSNIISQNAYVFVLATGMLLCILTGGNIDLSVGSVVCFVGAIGAKLMIDAGLPWPLAVLIMFSIGTLIGATQAFWIAYVRIPPFIVTLAGMLMFRGLSNVVLDGLTVPIGKKVGFIKFFGGGADCYIPSPAITFVTGQEPNLKTFSFNIVCMIIGLLAVVIFLALQIIGRGKRLKKQYEVEKMLPWVIKLVLISAVIIALTILLSLHKGLPSVLIIVMLVIVIYSYITNNTTTGRYFYAVGGNEKATRLSGINTNKTFFLAYTNMGFLASLAGMIVIARYTSAQPTSGTNFEMDAIASCFIGGASAYGGIGTVPGAIIGASLMGVINLGMLLLGVGPDMQKVIKGGVLLFAVILDVVSKRGFKLLAKN